MFLRNVASGEWHDDGAKASGFSRTLSKFNTYFMLKLLTLVFSGLQVVSAMLQKTALRFDQAEEIVKAVRESVSELRKQAFSRYWNETQEKAHELSLYVTNKVAPVPRQRKAPR